MALLDKVSGGTESTKSLLREFATDSSVSCVQLGRTAPESFANDSAESASRQVEDRPLSICSLTFLCT
jgi:catabolite regulation protein CreA